MSAYDQHPWSQFGHPAIFVTTVWSVVQKAGQGDENAKAILYQTYVYPMYCYLRRKGTSPEDAEELIQALFEKLLSVDDDASVSKNQLSTLEPAKGRMRTWLLSCINNLLFDELKKRRTVKRGAGNPIISLDALDPESRYQIEPTDHHTPEDDYERSWAEAVMKRAIDRLRDEFEDGKSRNRFETLKGFLLGDTEMHSYAETATLLGISEQAVKNAIFRLRRRLRELLLEEISSTVQSSDEIEDEMRYLHRVLCR
ncbi:MAG: RNA polymerase sigma factor [Verrucomicrobiales bacterium]|nr:RNA polymerase sigma factor [Verrucomicrobiales bacterium]